ncbi:MAG TPA: glycosyltransferase family 9 protein [Candidatus Omnitrophota bacterium]|nr:glycosyltransferase family 9 protein [Candidatus Omnitrophota bacterium]
MLFIKPSEMGTTVIMYPALIKAREIFPEAELFFLVFDDNAEILRVLNIIKDENILTIRTSSPLLFLKDVASAIVRLRREGIDAAVDMEFFSRFTSIISYLSGAKKRAGFYRYHSEGLYRGDLMTHKINYNSYIHTGASYVCLVLSLGYPASDMPFKYPSDSIKLEIPKFELSQTAKEKIFVKLKERNPAIDESNPIVLINPSTSQFLPFRKWPLKKYAALAKSLLENNKDIFIIITGIKSDIEDGDSICSDVDSSRCFNMMGKTSVRELIDLFNVSDVLVSVDSGPAHFAALTGINIVCIFGPETPILFSPLSDKCISLTCGFTCHPCMSVLTSRKPACDCEEKKCLEEITVDKVRSTVQTFLEKGR